MAPSPVPCRQDVVAQACNSSIGGVEARGLEVQSESEASLARLCENLSEMKEEKEGSGQKGRPAQK